MFKAMIWIWVFVLIVMALSLLGGKTPVATASPPKAQRAQIPPAKPIDPAQERQEREAKFDAVRRGEISFCEAFKSDLQSVTGISKPCLSGDR